MDKLEPLAYTLTQAAEAVATTRQTVTKWTHMNGFPVARIGGCVRIPVRAFERWLEKQAGVAENE